MSHRAQLLGLCGVLALGGALPSWAGVPVSLPSTEVPADWKSPLTLADLDWVEAGGAIEIRAVDGRWELRARDAQGVLRRAMVDAPGNAAEREEIAAIAAAIARAIGHPEAPPAPEPQPPASPLAPPPSPLVVPEPAEPVPPTPAGPAPAAEPAPAPVPAPRAPGSEDPGPDDRERGDSEELEGPEPEGPEPEVPQPGSDPLGPESDLPVEAPVVAPPVLPPVTVVMTPVEPDPPERDRAAARRAYWQRWRVQVPPFRLGMATAVRPGAAPAVGFVGGLDVARSGRFGAQIQLDVLGTRRVPAAETQTPEGILLDRSFTVTAGDVGGYVDLFPAWRIEGFTGLQWMTFRQQSLTIDTRMSPYLGVGSSTRIPLPFGWRIRIGLRAVGEGAIHELVREDGSAYSLFPVDFRSHIAIETPGFGDPFSGSATSDE